MPQRFFTMGFFSSSKKKAKDTKDTKAQAGPSSSHQNAADPYEQNFGLGGDYYGGYGFGSSGPPTTFHTNVTNLSDPASEFELSSWKSFGFGEPSAAGQPGSSHSSSKPPQPSNKPSSKSSTKSSSKSSTSSASIYPAYSNSSGSRRPSAASSGSLLAAIGLGNESDSRGRSRERGGQSSMSSSGLIFPFDSDIPGRIASPARLSESPGPLRSATGSSSGSWAPTAAPPAGLGGPKKSKWFGGGSSSSSPSTSSGNPSAAPSSGKHAGGIGFGFGSTSSSGSGSSSGGSTGPGPKVRPIVRETSYVSGFSDQFTPTGHRFRPDTELDKGYRSYKADAARAREAQEAYHAMAADIPHRPKKVVGHPIAVGRSHPDLNANLLLDERMYSEPVFCVEAMLTRLLV